MELIRSKVERPSPAPHLIRPRLVDVLRTGVDAGLATLVVGRAGTGKTVAVADLARSMAGRDAWYTVDESDTEFERFAAYLFEALGLRQRPDTRDLRPERVAELLTVEVLDRPNAPDLLVVEDLHLVYDTSWFGPFFSRLLPMLPGTVHVLMTTRAMPPVPLWRMRSKQSLAVVDEDVLTFSEAEAAQLFARYGLPEVSARAAIRATRGRAARLDAFAQCLAGDNPVYGVSTSSSPFRRTG